MGAIRPRHRPLLAGIGIKASDGSYGTLTGLATRNSDGEKVLVTNLHVVSTSGWAVSGGTPRLRERRLLHNPKAL